eukprot:jgi/Bigna1/75372/fgenesh1_pg.34_\
MKSMRDSFDEKRKAGLLPPVLRKLHDSLPLRAKLKFNRRPRVPAVLKPCRQTQSARTSLTPSRRKKKESRRRKPKIPKPQPSPIQESKAEIPQLPLSRLQSGAENTFGDSEFIITPRWTVKDSPGAVRRPVLQQNQQQQQQQQQQPEDDDEEDKRSPENARRNQIKQSLGKLDLGTARPQTSYSTRDIEYKEAEEMQYDREEREIEKFRREIREILQHKLVGSPQSARARRPCKVKFQPSEQIETIACREDLVDVVATPRPGAQQEAERRKLLKQIEEKKLNEMTSQFKFSDDSLDLEDLGNGNETFIKDDDLVLMGVRSSAFQNVTKESIQMRRQGGEIDNSASRHSENSPDEERSEGQIEVHSDMPNFDDDDKLDEIALQRNENVAPEDNRDDKEGEDDGKEGIILTHTSPDVLASIFG